MTPDEIFDQAQDAHADGRLPDAAALYRQALAAQPQSADNNYFLGLALFQLGQANEALTFIRRAIALDAAVPEFHCDLGLVLFALDDLDGAIASVRHALTLRPNFPEALFVLGNALCKSARFEEGVDAYESLIVQQPAARDAINNLGMALLELGRIEEAVACFDRILASDPKDAPARSNRIYAMHFSPAFTAADIRGQLIGFQHQHASELKTAIPSRSTPPNHNQPLRIGYVSPDFREHVVGWNMRSWIGRHDAEKFKILGYSSVARPDAVTSELQSLMHQWRDISRLSDADAARIIAEDQIDILVDLSLHTSNNRLLLFAHKPAPIQVTYLGYPGSTGLATMDYRLSDPHLGDDPEKLEHTERTICLPQTYWCYRPGGKTPDVSPPPALSSGVITFGCLNQFQKVSQPALTAWEKILQNVPGSRLLLHAPPGKCRAELSRRFAQAGIAPHRIEFVSRLPWDQYIQLYQRIDIALDPFPYGGGITTCDALWMGVPVITLRGQTSVGKSGASILSNLALPEFITHSTQQYIQAAVTLAQTPTRLSALRQKIRQTMFDSPLMNGLQFARQIETAFVKMREESALTKF